MCNNLPLFLQYSFISCSFCFIFYRITHALSQRLQALFTSLANSLFKPSVKYLNETNITKADPENGKDTSNLFFESDVEKSVLLLEQVLKTLLSVFTFDLYRFASKERFERFEILVQPLVDQVNIFLIIYWFWLKTH